MIPAGIPEIVRNPGWREVWVWLCHALLFLLAHLYFINALHAQFWIAVPAAALLLGLFPLALPLHCPRHARPRRL